MNFNKAIICGRITADPEMRSTPSGQSVTTFSVATNIKYTDKDGQKEDTEFHSVVAWGKVAEIVSQYTKKGTLILVEGKIKTRSWDEGKKHKTEIIAESVQFKNND